MPSNIRWFIAFRVFFNTRFYYPVLGVLFLDLGISAAQYAILNVLWAITIMVFEVPSGAVADRVGRRKLVVFAAAIMVLEMAVFALAPTGIPWLLFALMACNRVLSGVAEAAASGADEALAYDSIPEDQREALWPKVLRRLQAWQSAGFLGAMVLGGLVYDRGAWETFSRFTGLSWIPESTVRIPVYLTLVTAVLAFLSARQLKEDHAQSKVSIAGTYREVLNAGGWILSSSAVFLIILAGMINDSVVRLFLTFNSNYYRLLQLPEAWFGVLGAGFAALGFIIPALATWMIHRWNAAVNMTILSTLTFFGLTGIAFSRDWTAGIAFAALLGIGMFMTGFFLSHYLNKWVRSERRATVLSFRGLAFNLAYAGAGLAFAQILAAIRAKDTGLSEEAILGKGLGVLPLWFGVAAVIVLAIALWKRAHGRFPKTKL